MRLTIAGFCLTCLLVATAPAHAQFEPEPAGKGPRLGTSATQRYQVGVIISARSGPCRGLVATVPVPQDWPEQQVKVDVEEISKAVRRVRYSPLTSGVTQMLVSVPFLPGGQQAQALLTYEITRHRLLPPEDTSIYEIPKRLPLAERRYLGHSPLIESRHGDIRSQAREILEPLEDATAWEQVNAIHTWVCENIQEQRGKLKGAVAALRDGQGNLEDLNSLFIALCRASDIPARTVWVVDSSYCEFMLADDEGQTHWFPCRLTGGKEFGGIDSDMPVLQKGDNFDVPQRREPVRYVPEYMKGAGGRPSVEFVRKSLPN